MTSTMTPTMTSVRAAAASVRRRHRAGAPRLCRIAVAPRPHCVLAIDPSGPIPRAAQTMTSTMTPTMTGTMTAVRAGVAVGRRCRPSRSVPSGETRRCLVGAQMSTVATAGVPRSMCSARAPPQSHPSGCAFFPPLPWLARRLADVDGDQHGHDDRDGLRDSGEQQRQWRRRKRRYERAGRARRSVERLRPAQPPHEGVR
jgi:hypothetical protein